MFFLRENDTFTNISKNKIRSPSNIYLQRFIGSSLISFSLNGKTKDGHET